VTADAADAAGVELAAGRVAAQAAGEALAPQPVQILPRVPLTLTLVGDAGAACEGDACAL
jgi:hypothetical protein